jgi:hypothetical protein
VSLNLIFGVACLGSKEKTLVVIGESLVLLEICCWFFHCDGISLVYFGTKPG